MGLRDLRHCSVTKQNILFNFEGILCPRIFSVSLAVRLYDTITGQCFVASNPREYHTGPINMVSALKMTSCLL